MQLYLDVRKLAVRLGSVFGPMILIALFNSTSLVIVLGYFVVETVLQIDLEHMHTLSTPRKAMLVNSSFFMFLNILQVLIINFCAQGIIDEVGREKVQYKLFLCC